mmetsp:Transcript_26469/g.63010  ORF Transcript_26469/g.63010 Transcript_26469/m.63010 type:complete len:525 (+) Transcript_26469:82-1656(+)
MTDAVVSNMDVLLYDAIVVGTGLAGLVVALELLDRGATVAVIEKEPKMGGNSIKASSGINACVVADDAHDADDTTADVVDNSEIQSFVDDTTKSAGDRANPELIQILVEQSTDRLQWLKDRVDVDLFQNRARLGGHSRTRTHRPAKGTIGFTLISAMKAEVEKYQSTGRLKVMLSTKVTSLVRESSDGSENENGPHVRGFNVVIDQPRQPDDSVAAVSATKEEKVESSSITSKIFGRNVILATGGFAADRSSTSILAKNAPADYFLKLPATFGEFSTGDGIQIATQVGANTKDLDKIQIHPTGFVDPTDPDSPSKILCAELMRGNGGILLNQNGDRFCNELGTRDYVTGEMLKMYDGNVVASDEEGPRFYILLSEGAGKGVGEHIGFYTWKKLLNKTRGIKALAEVLNVDESRIKETLTTYKADAQNGQDGFGKTTFPNPFSDDFENEEFLVGQVTPVLHYCMGGLDINSKGQVLDGEGSTIKNLYAVGEVAGGVHGSNRLAGNSLLECMVFGGIIGRNLQLSV